MLIGDSMNKKMLFLFNIKAGTSGIRTKAADIINIFTRGGYDVLAHPSQSPTDMEEIIKARGKEFDLVVTCGGDGSLNDTINGLLALEDPPALGYIPTGTMNDFASSHHLNSNMLIAAKDIVSGKEIYTDIGYFNGRCFSYVAAFGAFTDVAYDTPQATKNLLGKSAYIFEGIKRLPTITSQHLKVECEELETKGDYIYGMVSNALTVGGININNKAPVSMDDGYFELILVKKGISEIFNAQVMLAAFVQGVEHNKFIEYAKTKRVVLTGEEPVSWTLDGEYGGDPTVAEIKCVPKRLKIMVPDKLEIRPQRTNIFGGPITP